ncbi:MAG: CPBP family intramembrane metalloprotease [Lachnospiraceae bacterium]|nr:CPBP family intramembrane metalloprotease [Lachnospiraceae bacterium]
MKKESILNKKIELPNEKGIIRVGLIMYIYYWLLYCYDLTEKIDSLFLTNLALVGIMIGITLPFYFIYRKWTRHEEKLNLKNWKQYVIAMGLLVLVFINYLIQSYMNYGTFGFSFDTFERFNVASLLFCFFQYACVVAVTEEFMFRVLIQNELVDIFGRFRWLVPVITAAYFGYIHTVQGNVAQAWSAFVFGLILGYAKLYIKNCTYLTLVIVHGLYDYLIVIL